MNGSFNSSDEDCFDTNYKKEHNFYTQSCVNNGSKVFPAYSSDVTEIDTLLVVSFFCVTLSLRFTSLFTIFLTLLTGG